jgi:hypothetical protein
MLQEDPNEAVLPDFTSDEYQPARQRLVQDGLDDGQAARTLASLWTLENNAAKERWALRQQRLENLRQQQEQEEEDRLQLAKDEEEAARLEERKKFKNKYAPVKRVKIPSDPSIIPAAYAIRKLKAGEFCELHYFTNRGLDDAKEAVAVAEPDALVLLPESNGSHTWIPAAAVKDPKAAAVTKDENLSWEQFLEAAPRMITMMKVQDWPDDRIEMHIQFWSSLQNHRWRHSADPLKQRALLLYQSQQRRRWHLTAGTSKGWSIEEINQDLLIEAREELFNEHLERQTAKAIQVSRAGQSLVNHFSFASSIKIYSIPARYASPLALCVHRRITRCGPSLRA